MTLATTMTADDVPTRAGRQPSILFAACTSLAVVSVAAAPALRNVASRLSDRPVAVAAPVSDAALRARDALAAAMRDGAPARIDPLKVPSYALSPEPLTRHAATSPDPVPSRAVASDAAPSSDDLAALAEKMVRVARAHEAAAPTPVTAPTSVPVPGAAPRAPVAAPDAPVPASRPSVLRWTDPRSSARDRARAALAGREVAEREPVEAPAPAPRAAPALPPQVSAPPQPRMPAGVLAYAPQPTAAQSQPSQSGPSFMDKVASFFTPRAESPAPGPKGYAPGTAVYDISAHTVYLPNGQRLEAHSGLGALMDDPTHVSTHNRGSTPPNVYDLKPREAAFHGVRALRLTPVGGGSTYGRTGLLAHTYMLRGQEGASNGCVSFKDYKAFLDAYERGEVRHLAVVDRQG